MAILSRRFLGEKFRLSQRFRTEPVSGMTIFQATDFQATGVDRVTVKTGFSTDLPDLQGRLGRDQQQVMAMLLIEKEVQL